MMDCMQLWLSVSVILSWVMRSKYFFPIPSIPISPRLLTNNTNPLARFGFNIGPMIITFFFRLVRGRIEVWVGKVLSGAYQHKKKERKAAKKEKEHMEAARAKQQRRAARATRRVEREVRTQAASTENPNHQGMFEINNQFTISHTIQGEVSGMNDLD